MNTRKKGAAYEDFVANVYKALLCAEGCGVDRNLTIEKHKSIVDRNGVTRDLDIFWEYELLGQKYTTAIECKNYETAVAVEKVEAFATKLKNLGIHKGIFAAKTGFQGGAVKTGLAENISLLVIRQQNDADWDGYLKTVHIHITAMPAPRISKITPKLDRDWVKLHAPHLIINPQINYNCLCTEVLIDDYSRNEKYSICELANRELRQTIPGKHVWRKEFEEAYFVYPDGRLKIEWIELEYIQPAPLKSEDIIDFSPLVLGIMEYIGTERKKIAVLHDGQQKPFE